MRRIGCDPLIDCDLRSNAGGNVHCVYSFGTTSGDPLQPHGVDAIAQGRDGDLYTTSNTGGAGNVGTLFKVSSSGALSVVYSFSYSPGNDPISGATLGTDGNFYGTTELDGEGPGTAWMITAGGVATALHFILETPATGLAPTPHRSRVQTATTTAPRQPCAALAV